MSNAAETYDPGRFRSTVPYYARYRLGYPPTLIDRVISFVGLKRGDAVMDLGCGPGLLAVLFAQAGMVVTAIDPETAMLRVTQEAAQAAGVVVDAREGSSFAIPEGVGPFKLAVMGRSFHWMDRAATLAMLDRLVAPEGAVVLMHNQHSETAENAWRKVLRDTSQAYGRSAAHHVRERESPDYRRHESMLFDSAFNQLEHVGVFIRRELTADDIIGLAYSLSTSSPQKLGERLPAFEAELRAGLAALSPNGRFIEIAEMQALIARRSGAGDTLRIAPPCHFKGPP